MPQFLLDTDHLTLSERGHPAVTAAVDAQPLVAVGLSAVTAEEALCGRLGVVARARGGASRVRSYGRLPALCSSWRSSCWSRSTRPAKPSSSSF